MSASPAADATRKSVLVKNITMAKLPEIKFLKTEH